MRFYSESIATPVRGNSKWRISEKFNAANSIGVDFSGNKKSNAAVVSVAVILQVNAFAKCEF